MCPDNAVPDVQVLKRFLLGQLSREEAEPIERYLEQHPDITLTLADLVKDDTLIGSLRAAAGQPAVDPPELAGLVDKLSQLRSPGGDATVGVSGQGDDEALAGLAPPQGPGEIGRLGGYRVLKVLGAGGMGMVYHAEDVHLQRAVALKVMKASVAKNASARERFLREARAAAKLHSDHVVNIYQVGEDNQVVFLAMEFLEGLSLDDWLKRGRTPTLTQAARIGRQIALGLADAHACGLIHRDIKPGNIWLDSRHQGRAKLLDFGLARGDADEIHLTQSGAIVGTPAYMAPEQARGEKVDHRVDLFSLGVVLYRLTTGQLPFRGDNTMSILTALALDTPKAPREINPNIAPRMAALIERLLSKDREQRPATAEAVADELAAIEREAAQPASDERTVQIVGAASVSAPVVGAASVSGPVVPSARLRLRPRKYLVAAGLLLLLGGVAAAVVVVIIRDKQGNKIAEVEVPPEGSVEVRDKAKKPPAPQEGVSIEPESLAPLAAGEPLAAFALVTHPAKLPGVRSWSIETRQTFVPSTAAYRPDGKRLAVGSWDSTVHIWETQTGRLVQVLLTPAGATALAWSPDGRVLAVGTGVYTRATFLHDADTGRLLRTLESPVSDFIYALAWSPDGRKLRAWGDAKRCCTWEVATGKLLHAPSIVCPAAKFSPDGQRLAGIVSDNHRVRLWDTDTGKQVDQFSTPVAVRTLAWSPDGKRLASTGDDGLRVWDAETHKDAFHYQKGVSGINTPAWSPDGRRLVFTLANQEGVAVIEAVSGAEPRRLDDPSGADLAWSPDGTTIARINGGHYVRLYDAATRKRLHSLSEGQQFQGFAWSPDGQTLAVADWSETFLISADTGRIVAEVKEATRPLAWSPDGKLLAVLGPNNGVLLRQADGKAEQTLAGNQARATSLAWSPDGKQLASTAAAEKRVLIWDVAKGALDRELGPFRGAAESVKWSTDGRLLTFNVPEAGWHVWDVEKNQLVNDPMQWKVFWFDLAPDNRSALVAPSDKEVYRLRDLASGKDGARLPHSQAWPLAHPTWSPDGRLLAVSLYWGIEVWRPDLSKRLWASKPPIGPNQVAFSRDGKRLAGLTGERLYLWETDTSRPVGILMLGSRNNGLTITPEGHYTGNQQVERGIVMVVQKDDGTQEVLEPADFEQKYGFKNQPAKVRLTDK